MPARGGERSTIFVGAMSRPKQLRGFQTSSASGFRQTHSTPRGRRTDLRPRDRPPGFIGVFDRGIGSDEHFISNRVKLVRHLPLPTMNQSGEQNTVGQRRYVGGLSAQLFLFCALSRNDFSDPSGKSVTSV